MLVEIWSDVACPFCYVGKRHLEEALTRFDHADEVTVEWRSFQLAPDAPRETTQSNYEMLAAKFGRSIDQVREMSQHVIDMGAEAGIEFNMDAVVPTNTFDAHRLLQFAKMHDLGDAAKEHLLFAYFVEGRNLADHDTLAAIGVAIGLDAIDVAQMLETDAYATEVRSDVAMAAELTLTGVPAFVIDRKLLVSGAQPSESLLGALNHAYDQAASSAR